VIADFGLRIEEGRKEKINILEADGSRFSGF
jgi:hypothetical protein